MPAISLDGKTAIVTGASSGFGKVIAQALRDAGVKSRSAPDGSTACTAISQRSWT